MGKVISFINQKGGVSKTSSVCHLAYILANEKRKKIALIDFDGQGNTTKSFGLEDFLNKEMSEGEEYTRVVDLKNTMYELMCNIIITGEVPTELNKFKYNLKNVDIFPSNIRLNGLEKALAMADNENNDFLKTFVNTIRNSYDYVLIDSLPKMGLHMLNVLVASDEVIIPTNTTIYSIDGFGELLKNIQKVQAELNKDLKVNGILIAQASEGTSAFNYLVEQINEVFKNFYVYKPIIPFVKNWEESLIFGKIWAEHKPKHKASIRYHEFVEEFLEKERKEK